MHPYAFGVDVGGTTVKLGLFSRDGALLEKWEIPTRTQNNGKHVLPDIVASIRSKLSEKNIAPQNVEGIGIGVPGPVSADFTVNKCVNLGWGVFNLKEKMNQLLPEISNVAAGNDANVATLGELWQGGGKGATSMALLTLGTGVGCGVIEDGKLIVGSYGMAGECGHMIVNPDEPVACNCGGHGCLEQYASATGIGRMGHKVLAESDAPSTLRRYEKLNAKNVLDAAKAGDALAIETVDRCMKYLGLAMAYISHVTDPQCFVIGGGVSKAGQYLLDVLDGHYRKYVNVQKAKAELHLATLGNDAGIYGAARLILGE